MGFQPMGMGALGGDSITIKRKFRWAFEVNGICGDPGAGGTIDRSWVKIAARPNLDIEETEINFLNGKMFIPGKGTWQEMTVTYYDVSGSGLDNLYKWISAIYNFSTDQQFKLTQASQWKNYGAIASLSLYDGCGTEMENWQLKNTWVKSANFGELDYSSSEEVTVELTLRFAWVKLTRNSCGQSFPECLCTPCGT